MKYIRYALPVLVLFLPIVSHAGQVYSYPVGGWALNGGEQIDEANAISNAMSSLGVNGGYSGSSDYRSSSFTFSLTNGAYFTLDGANLGSTITIQHAQDWVDVNGNGWGRYNRTIGINFPDAPPTPPAPSGGCGYSLSDQEAQCYLDRYPDLQAAFGPNNIDAAKIHWQTYGCNEGRDYSCSGSAPSAPAPTCSDGGSDYPTCTCPNGANNPQACSTFTPVAALSASSNSALGGTIDSGQSTTIAWNSSYADSCQAAGGFSTGGATSGSASVSPTETATYQVTCTGSGGTSAPANMTVTVLHPKDAISASPQRVEAGSSTTVTWSSSDVSSCAVSGPDLSSTSGNSSQSVIVSSQSTYTITCQTLGSPISQSTIVNVVPSFEEF